MSLSKLYATDKLADIIKVEMCVNDDGSVASVSLSRVGKTVKSYQKAAEKAFAPYRQEIRLGQLDKKIQDKISLDLFVSEAVKGWNNVLLSDITGNEADEGFAPFNADNVRALLTRLPELYEMLAEKAMSLAEFRLEDQEESAKN